jgi:hypothetical protein
MALKPLAPGKARWVFAEVLKDVVRDFANPHRMQQSVFILGGAEFLLVCFRFQALNCGRTSL